MQKSILITGCSSGIGLSAAHYLRQRGYHVIAACRQEKDLIHLTQQGFDTVYLDLHNSDSIEQAAKQVLTMTCGRLYALFNNAGYGVYGALTSISRQQLYEQFSCNFFGIHQLTMLLLPAMIAQGEGRIIQMSSIMGFIATPGRGAYAASKYALEAWSDALRLELYHTGIKVCLIEPGPIKTAFSQNVQQSQQNKTVRNPAIAKIFTLTPSAILPKLLHALESKRPRVRYRITVLTKVSALLKRILPDRAMDYLLKNK